MRLFVFPIYPIVVSGRLDLDIGDIVVGHFLLDGFDMLDRGVWAPDCGHRVRQYIRGASGCAARGGGQARNDLFHLVRTDQSEPFPAALTKQLC
jgi:hypothetical protein